MELDPTADGTAAATGDRALDADDPLAVPLDSSTFFREVTPGLVRTLTVRTGDRAAAQDLAHEAMARALADWDRVSTMASPTGWVYRVALNLAASRWRRLRRWMRIEAATDRSEPGVHLLTADALALRGALDRLSERQRQVIVLRYYSGFDVREVADMLDVSPSTVKTQTARALSRLRVALDGEAAP